MFSSLYFVHTFSSLPLFSLVPGLPPAPKINLLFKHSTTLTSFLFSSPSHPPFFEHTFPFFQLHGFPAPFQHTFSHLPFFEHTFTFFFQLPTFPAPFF